MQVLIVDDDEFALSVLENTLGRMGFSAVCARNGNEALEVLRQGDIRLVVTDWDMPDLSGIELCRAVRREDLSGYVYIIMLTGREGPRQRLEGLLAGADDFLNKPLDPDELLVCLKTAERILSLETREVAMFALAKLAESRDSETGDHIERVQSYTRLLARHLSPEVKSCHGVDDEFIRLLYQTSPLHDLGKVGIPDAILLKPGALTAGEFQVMKTHTTIGAQTLDAALQRFPTVRFLQMAREIAATHHEKFDGSGYPAGLIGQQIPLCGRIVAVADVYDALTSRRVYKDAMSHAEASAIILQDSGTHFDPEVVSAFVRAEPQILAVYERLQDQREYDIPRPQLSTVLPPSATNPNPRKILVVEDDDVLLRKLAELLAATGQTILRASDGAEALKLVEEHSPDVVISDWIMPRMDGIELCRAIREGTTAGAVHFIMLTAHSEKSRLLEAYKSGVDDFVSKPFDQEELLARVRAGLRTLALHEELIRKASAHVTTNAQLATMNSRLERLSITDELTGIFNRRHAMVRMEDEWVLTQRHKKPLSVAILDIDLFKRINDTHGHDVGDIILRQVSVALREELRGVDTLCRIGGEEFLIIFPSQAVPEVCVCAERCRRAIESQVFRVKGADVKVSISIGVAGRTAEMGQFTDLLKAADQALYVAKNSGRNTVRTFDQIREQINMDGTMKLQPALCDSPPPSLKPPVDLDAVLKRCGGDAKFAAAVSQKFCTQAEPEVTRIANALAAGNVDIVRRSAHSLKSMAAFMACETASELAKQIEDLGHANRLADVPPLLDRLRVEVQRATTWIAENNSCAMAQSA